MLDNATTEIGLGGNFHLYIASPDLHRSRTDVEFSNILPIKPAVVHNMDKDSSRSRLRVRTRIAPTNAGWRILIPNTNLFSSTKLASIERINWLS